MAEFFPFDVSSIGSYSGSFSGSFFGNGSGIIGISSSNAISASYALSASFAANGGVTQLLAGTNISLSPGTGKGQVTINSTGGGSTFPFTGSALITGSLILTGSLNATGSVFLISSNTNIVSLPAYVSNDFFLVRNTTTSLSINSGVQITSSANTPLQVLGTTNNNLLQVSQSGVVIYATSSVTPTGTAPNGALLFTSSSLFIGLD